MEAPRKPVGTGRTFGPDPSWIGCKYLKLRYLCVFVIVLIPTVSIRIVDAVARGGDPGTATESL